MAQVTSIAETRTSTNLQKSDIYIYIVKDELCISLANVRFLHSVICNYVNEVKPIFQVLFKVNYEDFMYIDLWLN